MTVMEAVKKFEQLARLCPNLITGETEKVRLMMKMFRTDIARQVSAGDSPPVTVSDCIERALRAEYWINRDKEARAQFYKSKKEEKALAKTNQSRHSTEAKPQAQSSNPNAQGPRQPGKNKRKGNFNNQGQQKNFPQMRNNQGNERNKNIEQTFSASLPSGEVLWSNFWIQNVPIRINGRELLADLIAIRLHDFDVILGMDFLGRHNAKIDCRKRNVTFSPCDDEDFSFQGQ
ncbi:hypothetical protein TIFTF001_055545, partial [Ficus carica]